MKINRLETHDRLLHFKKDQVDNVTKGLEECLKHNRLSLAIQKYSPYIYIYAHARTADDGVNKRILWQPRLSKPKPQVNSFLFRAKSNTDIIEICWIIPQMELWDQYRKGNVTENETVLWSINQYLYNRKNLERPYSDDLSEEKCKWIYETIAQEIDEEIRMEKLYKTPEEFKPMTLAESSSDVSSSHDYPNTTS